MHVLVIGGSGFIGSKLVYEFLFHKNRVDYTYFTNKLNIGNGKKLDIREKNSTVNLITRLNPDLIIHTVALTNVDMCETNQDLANAINIEGLENVIESCKKINRKIIFLSTSFVFDGKKSQYSENDAKSPSTYYGLTKSLGEKIIQKSGLPFLILRTDQPYDWKKPWHHTNSVLRAIETLKKGDILNEIKDWWNVPTYVPDFTNALYRLTTLDATGIFHVSGSDYVNRYDWSLKAAQVFGLDQSLINPIFSHELNLPAKRVNVNLSNEKLFKLYGIKMNGIVQGMNKMKNNFIHK